jgi:mycothiol synthase
MPIRTASFPGDRPAVDALLAAAEEADGHGALTEDTERDYRAGPTVPCLVAAHGSAATGYAHVREGEGEFVVEIVGHPETRARVSPALLEAALRAVGPGPARLWTSDPHTIAAAERAGFVRRRALLQLTRPLPPGERPSLPFGFTVGTFRPGIDEDDYLEVGNAAFVGHPDNDGWGSADLAERTAREWFDPAGVFIARRGTTPAAACWTKVHPGRVGEIYVIAVHPAHQGIGLGKALMLLGLWHLFEERRCAAATVYTEEENEVARRLYGRLGFEGLRIKRCLAREGEPS